MKHGIVCERKKGAVDGPELQAAAIILKNPERRLGEKERGAEASAV